jgi:hypothetical protein
MFSLTGRRLRSGSIPTSCSGRRRFKMRPGDTTQISRGFLSLSRPKLVSISNKGKTFSFHAILKRLFTNNAILRRYIMLSVEFSTK